MEFFKIRRDIPFMKNALIFNVISFLTFAAAVFFLFSRGLHLSVEFTGGTVMQVSYSQPADLEAVRGKVSALGYQDVQVQNFGNSRDVIQMQMRQIKRVDIPVFRKQITGHFGSIFTRIDYDGLIVIHEDSRIARAYVQLNVAKRVGTGQPKPGDSEYRRKRHGQKAALPSRTQILRK